MWVCPTQSDHLSQRRPTQCKSSLFQVFKKKLHGIAESKGFQKQHNLFMHRFRSSVVQMTAVKDSTPGLCQVQARRTCFLISMAYPTLVAVAAQSSTQATALKLPFSRLPHPHPLRLLTCHKSLRLDSPPASSAWKYPSINMSPHLISLHDVVFSRCASASEKASSSTDSSSERFRGVRGDACQDTAGILVPPCTPGKNCV